jgi:hypothetical protein
MFSFVAELFSNSGADETGHLFSVPNRRNFDAMFSSAPDDKSTRSTALAGEEFKPEQSYFSVRIVEMRMAEAGNYVAQYLPMCCCFLRYQYGASTREIPFIVSHDMIRRLLGAEASDRGARHVNFKDVYIVRDVPVKAAGVAMYAGLSRIVNSDFARGMLDLVGDTVSAFGGPAAGVVASAGINMTKRLADLLGANGVSTRFGVYDGDALVRSGYRVLAGAGLEAARIEMRDGQLRRTDDAGNLTLIDDVDYIVLAFERKTSLLDQPFGTLTHLPFHAKWTEMSKRLVTGETAGVDELFNQLAAEIVASPDLIELDRLGVLTGYVTQMDKWRQFRSQAPTVKAGGQTLRGMVIDRANTLSEAAQKDSASLLQKAAKHINDYRNDPRQSNDLLSDDALADKLGSIGRDLSNQASSIADIRRATNELLVAAYTR